jgi:L-alanine-DL-glutamate epimerase-like enolase superfamily enzyme
MDTVRTVEVLRCDAGWRDYCFVKLTTDDGVVGWSEFDEGFGSPGVGAVIEQLTPRVVGHRVAHHQRCVQALYFATRPGAGGVVGQAIGAIENALLDAHARTLGVPCHELLGGATRERVRVYWSHAATWRIARADFYGPPITDRSGMVDLGREVRERGFSALKTNMFRSVDGRFTGWVPGFGRPHAPELVVDRALLRDLVEQLTALREGAGDDVDILLDLNFNFRTSGYLEVLRAVADLGLFWVEIDTDSPQALAHLRSRGNCRISGCETLIGPAAFVPYLSAEALDVAIVDGIWNGMWQALGIATLAAAHQVNVAPHNFYGHLSTFMNLHWAAAVPNLEIMEVDVDRLAWDSELFTTVPEYVDGHLAVPDTPGWGCAPDERALSAHPPRSA